MLCANVSPFKVKEMSFKAPLVLAAIIITDATDGPRFCMGTSRQGVLIKATTEREETGLLRVV